MELKGPKVILREKRLEDAEMDYQWRCDPEVAELDASLPLTMSFDRFLRLFKDQLQYPTPGSVHFAIETRERKYIGNCMYYDLDMVTKEAEMGIVIGDRDYWSHGYGSDSVNVLLGQLFAKSGLERVYLHTLKWNQRAQRCFEKCGFMPVSSVRRTGQEFMRMEVSRARWLQLHEERDGLAAQGPAADGQAGR